jgi:NhaA family Na+:H+ antiporter
LIAIRCKIGRLPEGTNWMQIYGAALVAGIGFTMSLFIGTLAFSGPEEAAYLRIGVLAGSFASAIAGYVVLRMAAAPLLARA